MEYMESQMQSRYDAADEMQRSLEDIKSSRGIKTTHLRGPSFHRSNWNWCAVYPHMNEDSPQGWGDTEDAAIQDLIDNYDAPS